MNISVLRFFCISITCLLWGSASAFSMRMPQQFSPAYTPASPTHGVASFTPYYRPSPTVQGLQRSASAGYPQWGQRMPSTKRIAAPWPFPVSYRPVRPPVSGYNQPMPYRPYGRSFYYPAGPQAANLWKQPSYRPTYGMAPRPLQSGRGINMADQSRRNSPYQRWYPRNYANLHPRGAAPTSGYGYPQYPQRQVFTNSGKQRYVANPYRFRPMQPARRYVPGYFVQQRGAGYPDVAGNYPMPRRAAVNQWRQTARSYGQAAYQYGQSPYRFRPDPRFSYHRLPASMPSNFDAGSRRDQATRGWSTQATNGNHQASNVRRPQAGYPKGVMGRDSRVAYR